MSELSSSLKRARELDVEEIARSIQNIGFSCTRCGACCRGTADDPHTATIFPDEVRTLQTHTESKWKDVARPIPYGLSADGTGETFEWALQTDTCGDCTYLVEHSDGTTACGVYDDRPAICRTYPFQLDLTGTTAPTGDVNEQAGDVLAYECEGLGTAIDWKEACALAAQLKERTIHDIQEAIALLDQYDPDQSHDSDVIVHDSEGPKRPDGQLLTKT